MVFLSCFLEGTSMSWSTSSDHTLQIHTNVYFSSCYPCCENNFNNPLPPILDMKYAPNTSHKMRVVWHKNLNFYGIQTPTFIQKRPDVHKIALSIKLRSPHPGKKCQLWRFSSTDLYSFSSVWALFRETKVCGQESYGHPGLCDLCHMNQFSRGWKGLQYADVRQEESTFLSQTQIEFPWRSATERSHMRGHILYTPTQEGGSIKTLPLGGGGPNTIPEYHPGRNYYKIIPWEPLFLQWSL